MSPIEGELTAPDDSLRSELEAAFSDTGANDASNQTSANDDVASSGAENVSGAAADNSQGTSPPDDGRARGADGKFIPKEAAPEKVAAAQDSPSTDAAKASEVAVQPVANAPPAGWTAAEKAEWAKLSPAVQAAVSRREQEMSRGGQQWSEEKRRYETAISPIATLARSKGLSTEEGIQRLARAQQMLDSDPVAALKEIAVSYGVNLATLAGSPGEVSSAQAPDIEAIVRQAVQRTVTPLVAPIQDRWRQEEQSRQDTTTQMVVEFAASAGHEHFNSVEEEIMAMIVPLKERNPTWSSKQVLQEAYDRAVYANPVTRQSILTANEAAAEAKRREEASQRATKARGAAVSVTGSPQGSAANEPAASLRDEILRAMTG